MKDVETALRANPSTPRILIDKRRRRCCDRRRRKADAADVYLAVPDARLDRPVLRGRGCSGEIRSGCGPARKIRTSCAPTSRCCLQRPDSEIDVIRMEAAGCYGRNCADDVSADAVLLSRAVGRPVRVQLTREQEHAWEPKGTAQLMDVKGGLRADGSVAGYDFATRYPSNGAPTLALLLTGTIAPVPAVFEMGDRTAIPPYDYDAMRVVAHDMPPIVRASWLRGVSALPNTFAHESLYRRIGHRSRRRSDRISPALPQGPARDRPRQRRCQTRRLGPSPALEGAGGRRRHRARAGLCLRALCPQHVSRLWRGVVGLDRRCRGQ